MAAVPAAATIFAANLAAPIHAAPHAGDPAKGGLPLRGTSDEGRRGKAPGKQAQVPTDHPKPVEEASGEYVSVAILVTALRQQVGLTQFHLLQHSPFSEPLPASECPAALTP